MRMPMTRYVLMKKSTVAVLAILAAAGFAAVAVFVFLKKRGIDPVQEAEELLDEGVEMAKDKAADKAKEVADKLQK